MCQPMSLHYISKNFCCQIEHQQTDQPPGQYLAGNMAHIPAQRDAFHAHQSETRHGAN